eukprot:1183404-Prorocentrum_minimum.AAC.3
MAESPEPRFGGVVTAKRNYNTSVTSIITDFLDDARPPPTDPLGDASLAALGLSDRLARPGNVKEITDRNFLCYDHGWFTYYGTSVVFALRLAYPQRGPG